MKRLVAALSLVAISTSAVANAAPIAKPAAPPKVIAMRVSRVAPADEYFGRLKLSILGIRNTIKDLGLKVDGDASKGPSIMGSAALTEDAIHDWEKKYPKDTWVPRTIFLLERLYAKVDADDARSHSLTTMKWLVHDFPVNYFGKLGKKELADNKVGIPAAVSPAASATPASTATAGASAPSPGATTAPAAGVPTPASSTTPAPSPTP